MSRRTPETVCADLVALSCGRVKQGSPPQFAPTSLRFCASPVKRIEYSVGRSLNVPVVRPVAYERGRTDPSSVRAAPQARLLGQGETEPDVTLGAPLPESGGSAGWRKG